MGKNELKSQIKYVVSFFIIGSILGVTESSIEDFFKGGTSEVIQELFYFHHYTPILFTGILSGIIGLVSYYLFRDLKQNKALFKQERDQLLSVFDSIDQAIYVSDLYTNKVLFANKYIKNLIGEDPIGKICFRAIHGYTSPCEFCTNNKILDLDGKSFVWEQFNKKLNMHFTVSDRIIKWSNNRKVRLHIANNITDRKKAKQKADEKTAILSSFLQNSTDSILIWNKNLKLLEINNVALSFFPENTNKHNLIGQDIEHIMGHFEKSEHLHRYDTVLKTGIPLCYTHSVKSKNGNNLHFSISIFKAGENLGQISSNITSLIQAEEEMKTAIEDLTRSNKDLEQFAYIASHDLKAPLRSIHSLSEWLLKEYSDQLDEKGKEYLELMLSRVVRMNSFIDGILSYAQLDLNNDKLTLFSTKTVVDDVLASINIPNNISITTDDQYPEIKAKKTLIEQVFLNLIDNAIKHNDKKQGEISIESSEKDSCWQFTIRDNGPGIEPIYQEKVFNFFQTLQSKESAKNTGMGLPIVKKIIDHHSGNIWIESTPGENCSIIFTLQKTV